MDYAKPTDVVATMIDVSQKKLKLAPRDLLIRGALSGALLGTSTSLALGAAITTGQPLVGALIFPVGLIIIVLLGLELVTGSFGLLPLARLEGRATWGNIVANWGWVFVGNLIGSIAYGVLLAIALTSMGKIELSGVAAKIVSLAEAKTIGYAALGTAGMITVFVKAILCNWLVCLAVVMAMTTSSTIGKIAAAWMPVFIFFAQGFEHAVVNMFLIPTGMLLGAKVSMADWWLWNQIPVTLGNIVGGFVFTGLALYATHGPGQAPMTSPMASSLPAE
ncbi:formate transporter [Afipia sp. Root123D2]|uniref:formate/nitrite transporter family protein n=1 Tax=Afipia sp. Root123D2 TaxID=1736436 RepID=UPI0007008E00|nr:formate/nitrite transporter family protein [Afipia sp. Root123D2]KQW23044.1 formate transporter [Afipia sp. Root123D2]